MKGKNNIQLATTDTCTGCGACVQSCAKGAISMIEDREGFLQPHIDEKLCVVCHKCEQTCPIVSPISIPQDFETKAYAAINRDEDIRMHSSSGGVFHALAKWTIEQGGVVFGARWDENWEVMHDYAEDLDSVKAFMRSKYVQSRVGNTYKQTKDFLSKGRWVLYSGTPCQIAGLHSFLGKDYNKLIMVGLICHGVPGSGMWRKSIDEMLKRKKGTIIHQIIFRDKHYGWSHSNLSFCFSDKDGRTHIVEDTCAQNTYFSGFNNGVILRKSCYQCPFRSLKTMADLIIGDCWNVWDTCIELFDDRGISTVVICSETGDNVWRAINRNFIVKEENVVTIANRIVQQQQTTQKQGVRRHEFITMSRIIPFTWLNYMVNHDRLHVRVIRMITRKLNRH